MNIKKRNKRKTPTVIVDNSLGKFKNAPVSLYKANELLRTVELPDQYMKKRSTGIPNFGNLISCGIPLNCPPDSRNSMYWPFAQGDSVPTSGRKYTGNC